ncbi:MAG: DUF1624 domain-containing protein [Planctomycetes bacterium]|nr:DUF1624 domain-containing protein [Planctomycetota bacterium]
MTETAGMKEKAPRSPRVWFVDVLRLLASFQMVNGHTLDAVMVASIRSGPFYERYVSMRGLVSVSFLVVAGIAFHLSTLCRFERHKSDPRAVRRRFRRAGFIILVGYFLRFPWGLFRAEAAVRHESLLLASQVDVLHCIGLTLLVLETITLLARRRRHVVIGSAITAAILILGAPLVDLPLDPESINVLGNWIGHKGGSLFPVFPWAGYVFVGLVVGALVFPDTGRTPFPLVLKRLALLTLGTGLAWLATAPLEGLLYDPATNSAATDPRHAVAKLGLVLGFLLLLAVLCRPIRALPRLFAALSQETLTVYALHLVFLFFPGLALARRFPQRFELLPALLCSAGMLVLTLGTAWAWHEFKAGRRGRALIPRRGSSDAG